MEFLPQQNRRVSDEPLGNVLPILAGGKHVVVIGGGDTGSDCVGTAIRQGAKKVYQYEILPEPSRWENSSNPDWPYWPDILRTSSSHEEGCERGWSVLTKQFSGREITLTEGHFARVEWHHDKRSGKRVPAEVPGSEFSLTIDLVLLAMGFLHVEHNRLTDELGIEFDDKGNIKCGGAYATSADGVFVAGDAATGASLVVRAIHHGREAAKTINKYLVS
jgi:glutamate synthase (NADPH/NADH) small chain